MPVDTSQTQTIPDKEKQPKKPQGSGFTNLQSVLGANQQNRLGGAVTGQITGATDQTKENLASQQQQYSNDLSKARSGIQNEKQAAQGVLSRFDAQNDFQDTNQDEEKQFANLRSEQYSGPQGLQNAQTVQDQAARAAALGQMAGSRTGRQELLKGAVGANPAYSPTKQRLDELILSLGGNQQGLNQAAGQTRRLGQQVQGAVQSAQFGAKQAAGELSATQQQIANEIQSRLGGIGAGVDQKLGTAKESEAKRIENVKQYQTLLSTNPAEAAAFAQQNGLFNNGVSEDLNQIQQYLTPEQYATLANNIQAGSTPLSRGYVASDAERAKINALARLGGQQQEFLNPRETAVGAGLKLNPEDFDPLSQNVLAKSGFSAAELAKQQKYSSDYGRLAQGALNSIPVFTPGYSGGPNDPNTAKAQASQADREKLLQTINAAQNDPNRWSQAETMYKDYLSKYNLQNPVFSGTGNDIGSELNRAAHFQGLFNQEDAERQENDRRQQALKNLFAKYGGTNTQLMK